MRMLACVVAVLAAMPLSADARLGQVLEACSFDPPLEVGNGLPPSYVQQRATFQGSIPDEKTGAAYGYRVSWEAMEVDGKLRWVMTEASCSLERHHDMRAKGKPAAPAEKPAK